MTTSDSKNVIFPARPTGFEGYGLNFFGERIRPEHPLHDPTAMILNAAAKRLPIEMQKGRAKLFANCGLGGFIRGPDILKSFSNALLNASAPHIVPVDLSAPTFFLIDSAEEMLPLLLAQRWDVSIHWDQLQGPLWLEAYFDALSRYVIDLVKGGFRDRNGVTLPFPLSIAQLFSDVLEPTQFPADITSPEVAGQLVYAVTEFFGDELFGVYFNLLKGLDSSSYTCDDAGVITQALSGFVVTGGDGTDWTSLVGSLIAFAAKTTESSVRSTVGMLIRGAGPLGTNNEVLAEVVTTVISVLAKKAAEKFSYDVLTDFIVNDTTMPAGEKEIVLADLAKIFAMVN